MINHAATRTIDHCQAHDRSFERSRPTIDRRAKQRIESESIDLAQHDRARKRPRSHMHDNATRVIARMFHKLFHKAWNNTRGTHRARPT